MSDIVQCPHCGFRFSKAYSRVKMCKSCPESINRCMYIMCPNCKKEFSEFGR
ncbi:MAG TPA: hypothetical protein PK718_07030 [Candidatus Methanofastidiosa archaeon]|nr:hypothetical protein [Candidatus Methanofastidiosa archaeon]HPR42280.1 hypothetical protein [Candidatus Methanofastidiosa archaeon]